MSSLLTKQQMRALHPIIISNWREVFPATIDQLIDSKKLVSLEGRTPLAKILDSSLLSDSDKTCIKNKRDRLNRTKATRKFREKNRFENLQLEGDIGELSEEKLELINSRNNLLREIHYYSYHLLENR